MPSTFRSSRSGRHLDGAPNRTRTGQIDHDVFEGLPVRRWSKQPYTFSQAPKTTDSEFGVQGPGEGPTLPELPMPRDSQLLPPISRALLRAARAGCINILQGSRAGEDEEKSVADAEDSATASHTADRSFTTRKWQTLPKHLEPAEVEFLAKRRPGLPSLYGASAGTDGSFGTASGPMRRTKFKKTDPETGNISIYQAWVPEGHRIEGEITGDLQTIVEQSDVPVKPEAPAPGTVVEGVGIVNAEGVVVAEAGSAAVMTPPKRRPPPPKRKGRGIGKGRKKKVMFAPGEGADAAMVHGVAPAASNGEVKGEGQEGASQDQTGQDEDDEDGDEGDESDDGDESMLDAKTPDTPRPLSETPVERPSDVDMADTVPDRPDALELSSLPEKEPSPQKQPMVPEPSQVDVSTVKEEAQPNETPLPQEKPTTTSELAEPTAVTGEAQESNPELQGRDPAGVPSSNIEPKEEPEQTSGEIKTTPPTASPRQPSENPTAQPALQSHIPEQEQPLGEVTNPDENTVPTGPSDQAQKSPDLPNEPPLNSNTQDKPSLASESASASAQENPPLIGTSQDSAEAKDTEMTDASVSEQKPASDINTSASAHAQSDIPSVLPSTTDTMQSEPIAEPVGSATEVSAVADDGAAETKSNLPAGSAPGDGNTESIQAGEPEKSVVTEAGPEAGPGPGPGPQRGSPSREEAGAESEKIPESAPQVPASEST